MSHESKAQKRELDLAIIGAEVPFTTVKRRI